MQYIPTVYVKQETQWAYRLVTLNSAETIPPDTLTDLGNEGWELAAILSTLETVTYYFKRII